MNETIEVRGLPLRVSRAGDGPPLLLVNGIGASVEMWEPLTSRLAGREVIAFDLPGTGSSPCAPRRLRMPALAALVADLVAALGHDRVDVLGLSFGGLVAQQLARAAPGRVDRLILCSTTAGLPSTPNPLALSLMLTPARYYSRTLAEAIVPIIAGGRTRHDRAALEAHLVQRLANPPSTRGYVHQLYAVAGWSSAAWLHTVRHPTLIIHGGDDPLIPLTHARFMAWRMPNAQLHVVRHGGHLLPVDDPGAAAGLILSFTSRAAAQAPPARPAARAAAGRR